MRDLTEYGLVLFVKDITGILRRKQNNQLPLNVGGALITNS